MWAARCRPRWRRSGPIPSLQLATAIGLEPAALEATVREFNAATVAAGDDVPLNERGTTGISPPKSRGAVALTAPPFAAYPLRPGVTFTHYGVAVDDRLRVMKNDGMPIRNVFAAGMVMAANVLGDGYLAGLGVSLSAVFGRLAGEQRRAAGAERYLSVAQAASSRCHAASSAGSPNR